MSRKKTLMIDLKLKIDWSDQKCSKSKGRRDKLCAQLHNLINSGASDDPT